MRLSKCPSVTRVLIVAISLAVLHWQVLTAAVMPNTTLTKRFLISGSLLFIIQKTRYYKQVY
jgi:hypothetical protein